jgi:hypothetical protein
MMTSPNKMSKPTITPLAQDEVSIPRAPGNAKTTAIALKNNSIHTAAKSRI